MASHLWTPALRRLHSDPTLFRPDDSEKSQCRQIVTVRSTDWFQGICTVSSGVGGLQFFNNTERWYIWVLYIGIYTVPWYKITISMRVTCSRDVPWRSTRSGRCRYRVFLLLPRTRQQQSNGIVQEINSTGNFCNFVRICFLNGVTRELIRIQLLRFPVRLFHLNQCWISVNW